MENTFENINKALKLLKSNNSNNFNYYTGYYDGKNFEFKKSNTCVPYGNKIYCFNESNELASFHEKDKEYDELRKSRKR